MIYSRPHALAGPMSSIFLSHSSKDNFEAVALRGWLAREGWDDVFLDLDPERGIAAGERWERALHEHANRCEAVIFLVSANWLASGWCLREYALAARLCGGRRLDSAAMGKASASALAMAAARVGPYAITPASSGLRPAKAVRFLLGLQGQSRRAISS